MHVEVIKECGYEEALLGISLSFNADLNKMPVRAAKLAHMGGGHSKFLESIYVWLDVTASRGWWAQADTYRVGCSKQSASTMHTLTHKYLTQEDFLEPIPDSWLNHLNDLIDQKDLMTLKNLLPEGFLQRRIWCVNYKTLQSIVAQRRNHKLPEWKDFCHQVVGAVKLPGFLVSEV